MSENADMVNEGNAPRGEMGQRYLASGESVSMRLWDGEEPGEPKPEAARPYETVGYVTGAGPSCGWRARPYRLRRATPGPFPRALRTRT